MGLATTDSYNHKMQTKLYKIPKFGVNSKIQAIEISKFTTKCMAIRTLSDKASGWPHISLLILAFLNRCISVKTSLTDNKFGDFVNLGVLFLTM